MSSQYAIASITNLVVIFCHVSMSVSCSRQISWPTDKDRVGFIAVLVLSWMDEFATAWCNCGHYEFAAEKLVLSLLNGLLDPGYGASAAALRPPQCGHVHTYKYY